MEKSIVLCEPCKIGFDQATFTAALARSALLAWPGARVSFLAEKGHSEWTLRALARHDASCVQRVDALPLEVPPKNSPLSRRGILEARACASALKLAAAGRAEALIFSSTTTTLLFVLKSMLLLRPRRTPVVVVPHDILGPLVPSCARGSRRQRASLRAALGLPHAANLRYVVLGEPVRKEIGRFLPGAGKAFRSIDLPYLMHEPASTGGPVPGGALRMGFSGGGMKGFPAFARLAEEVGGEAPGRCQFVLVGSLDPMHAPDGASSAGKWVEGVSCEPLSAEEYGRRASSLTYALWTADPEAYRLRMSATFLDAMAFAKPVVGLRTPWMEYYFDRMGDIGHLCKDLAELKETVVSLARAFPRERYERQCRNILAGRRIFAPETVGTALRRIAEEVGSA